MKSSRQSNFCFFIASMAIEIASLIPCWGHEREVHMAISDSACRSSAGLASFLTDNLGAENAPFTSTPRLTAQPPGFGASFDPNGHSPLSWIELGSYHEDDLTRFRNHFYTLLPKPVKGLTDPRDVGNLQSYAWATNNDNYASWQKARDYELAALTSPTDAARHEQMAYLFYTLGHILHLNQDLSQPDHVRNDAHPIPSHRWIENYGVKTYLTKPKVTAFPRQSRGWAYWRDAGFLKLQDFWDRGKYTGSASALNADALGTAGEKLGLAEFSNGNFLGEDATYAEYFKPGDRHYFPFPSLKTSTDFVRLFAPSAAVSFLKDGTSVQRFNRKEMGWNTCSKAQRSALPGCNVPTKGCPVA